jgi:hypothetical protein
VLDFIRLIRLVLEFLAQLRQPIQTLLIEPLVTVGLLLFLYAGWYVRDEGDVIQGLRDAFIDTRAYREERLRELQASILQSELRQSAEANRLVDQLLASLIQTASNAARVRLDVVHNGVTGITGMALLRYDVTNSVAAPGHSIGMLVNNEPLSDWSEFLPALLAGKCQLGLVDDSRSVGLRARLLALGSSAFLACPVIDVQGRLLGAVFVLWDGHDSPPMDDALRALMDRARNIGTQIASALDLRMPPAHSLSEQDGD